MSTESINPTSATVYHHTVTYQTRAFDDTPSTYCIVSYGIPLPDYGWVWYEDFGDGVTPAENRQDVQLALMGQWANLHLQSGYEFLIIQIKAVADEYWIGLLAEHVSESAQWPALQWRRFDITSIVGDNPLSNYHVRIGFYAGTEDFPNPDVPPPYQPYSGAGT